MISGISNSLSGLAAAQSKINAAAHNIANANTDGFKKTRAILEESAAGGVQVTLDTVHTPGPISFKETDQGVVPIELSNVDLAEEMVELIVSKHSFQANLGALRIQDDILGSLLDIVE